MESGEHRHRSRRLADRRTRHQGRATWHRARATVGDSGRQWPELRGRILDQ
jgi:hypothetical protein